MNEQSLSDPVSAVLGGLAGSALKRAFLKTLPLDGSNLEASISVRSAFKRPGLRDIGRVREVGYALEAKVLMLLSSIGINALVRPLTLLHSIVLMLLRGIAINARNIGMCKSSGWMLDIGPHESLRHCTGPRYIDALAGHRGFA